LFGGAVHFGGTSKTMMRTALLTGLLTATVSMAHAGDVQARPLQFAKGTSSATVKGSLTGDETIDPGPGMGWNALGLGVGAMRWGIDQPEDSSATRQFRPHGNCGAVKGHRTPTA